MAAPNLERLVSTESVRRAGRRSGTHPINRLMDAGMTRGDRIADGVSSFLGSWRFIVVQTVVVAAWIAGNLLLLVHFDPYPFIFLNLAFSTQAAYAAPLILLASNRSAMRDRLTLEHAASEADVEDAQNVRILEALMRVERRLERLEGQLGTAPR
jgi:uncharacterized membrane protein